MHKYYGLIKSVIEHWQNSDQSDKNKGKLIAHTWVVVELSRFFIMEYNGCINSELLLKSAILHDIAKFDTKNDHHNLPEEVKKSIKEANITICDMNAICSVIKEHRGKIFNPCYEYAVEAAILRMCDKLDKFRKEKYNAEEKCNKSIKQIEKYFIMEDRKQVFTEFYAKYEVLKKEIDT